MKLKNNMIVENTLSDKIFISLMPMVSNFMSYGAEVISARQFDIGKNPKS